MTGETKAHRLIARYRVALPAHYLGLLEATGDPVRIRGTKYGRYTFRGVPGRRCDVIVADSVMAHAADAHVVLDVTDHRPQALPPHHADLVMEIGEKRGKYDGAVRRRYALRRFMPQQIDAIPWADLRIVDTLAEGETAGEIMIVVRPRDGSAPVVDTFERLVDSLDDYDLERIALWHGRRYYAHLAYEGEVKPAAKAWADEFRATGAAGRSTLAEANRSASRYLYRLCRELGWRKLTEAEKARLYLPDDAPQWHRIESLLPRYAALAGNPLGVGEATAAAAQGDGSHWSEPLEYETEDY